MIATMQPSAPFGPGHAAQRPPAKAAARPQAIAEMLAAQTRTLGFIAAAVFLLALFRALVGASLFLKPVVADEFVANLARDFLHHLGSALLMWVVIEPVRRHAPESGVRRFAVIGLTVLVSAGLATVSRMIYLHYFDEAPWKGVIGSAHVVYIRFATLGAMLVAVGEFQRAETLSMEAMRHAEADRHQLEQQTLEARLKTLEAQIEPHFLFNTLATVRRLYDTDGAAGEAMLERLMRYLEVALPSMRSDRSTLGREAELIAAYLDLQKVRMGRRLDYRIDIASELGPVAVPPMMLLTLVENAIKHGLAPVREGGRVDVSARLEDAELRLAVADTGRGFGSGTSGGGTGLANIRARLAAMFGPAAELTLTPREPSGLLASIRLPAAALPAPAAHA